MDFCFIHIPKTAGSSIIKLAADTCSPISKGNNFNICEINQSLRVGKIGHNSRNKGYMTIDKFNAQYPDCFTFAFVRNPYDRLVSAFYHINSGGNNIEDKQDKKKYISKYKGNFEAFVLGELQSPELRVFEQIHFKPQYTWLSENDDIAVDFVGRVESLHQDINFVLDKFGLPRKEIEHTNKSNHSEYQNYYTNDNVKQAVFNAYKKDFELFGYEF